MRPLLLLLALLASARLSGAAGGGFLSTPAQGSWGQPLPPPDAAAPNCGANGTAVWRSTALAQRPARSEDFAPEHAEYWEETVLGAAWPALIGVGCAAALLAAFVLWCAPAARPACGMRPHLAAPRPSLLHTPSTHCAPPQSPCRRCLRCCCGACCACGCGRRPKGAPQLKYVTARWVGCLKIMAACLAAGLAAACALGMARPDAALVNAGLAQLTGVQLFAGNVVSRGRAAAAAADGMLGALGELQGVLGEEVNGTGGRIGRATRRAGG